MEGYRGLHGELKLPESISNFNNLSYIIQTTKKITEQVDLQSEIALTLYSLYSSLSQSVQNLCVQSEAKYLLSSNTTTLLCKQFIKTLHLTFHNFSQITFKHQIDLKTVLKRQRQQSWMTTITEKLNKLKQRITVYGDLEKQFQGEEERYMKKADYYRDIVGDTIKYYSLFGKEGKGGEIVEMELRMQKMLLRLGSEYSKVQLGFREGQKLLFELVSSKVKKVYEGVGLVREALRALFELEDVIVEEGSRDYVSNLSEEGGEERFEGKSPEEAIEAAKKVLENERTIRNTFEQFLLSLISLFSSYSPAPTSSSHLHLKKLTTNLHRSLTLLQQNLGCPLHPKSLSLSLPSLISLFQNFLQQTLYKLKTHKNFHKYKIMQQELFGRLEKELKSFSNNLPNGESVRDNQELYRYYVEMTMYLPRKYARQAEDINNSFRGEVLGMLKEFKELLHTFLTQLSPDGYHSKPPPGKLQSITRTILSSPQYSIFNHPFLLNPPEFTFTRSPAIACLLKVKSEIHYLPIDLSVDLSSEEGGEERGCAGKVGCCGMGGRGKENDLIDEFNCALVDTILIQGKLRLFKKEITFKSMFNKRTLFGKTEIKVPAKDIISIQKERKHINSITVFTQHGALTFASFLNNPIPLLLNTYKSKSSRSRSENDEINEERVLKRPMSVMRTSGGLRSVIVNRFKGLGFVRGEGNRLERGSSEEGMMVGVELEEKGEEVVVKMEYDDGFGEGERYWFKVKREGERLDIKYSLGEGVRRDNREAFLNFVRGFMGKQEANVHNTRSEIFDISSIESMGGEEKNKENQNEKSKGSEIEKREGKEKNESINFPSPNHQTKQDRQYIPILSRSQLDKSDKEIDQINPPKPQQPQVPPLKPQFNPTIIYLILTIAALLILFT